jgi:hypothetical protein
MYIPIKSAGKHLRDYTHILNSTHLHMRSPTHCPTHSPDVSLVTLCEQPVSSIGQLCTQTRPELTTGASANTYTTEDHVINYHQELIERGAS